MSKKLCLSFLILLYLLSLKVTYIIGMIPLKVQTYEKKDDCSIIVVLGGRDDQDRILKGIELALSNNEKTLLFSGVHPKYKSVVKKFSLENVVFEDASINTYQNVIFAKPWLEDNHGVCLVTSEAHLYRASKIYEKIGIDVYPVASNKNSMELKIHHFIPDFKYLFLNISVVYEYLALIQYTYQERI